MALRIDEHLLRKMWPHGDSRISGLIAGIARSSEAVLKKRKITTPLQLAHIMAQLSWECNAGQEVVENLNYTTPAAMMRAWPRRFPTTASTVPFLRKPRKLANQVYNGRMGNRPGTDDGYDFRGRGGSQTTGREGYARLGAAAGYDLLGNPDLLNDPDLFFDFAVADFIMCGCLPFCAPKPSLPLGDIEGVTFRLNGGKNGLAGRKQWFARWWPVLKSLDAAPSPARPAAALAAISEDQPAGAFPADTPEPAYADEAESQIDEGVLRYGCGHDKPDFKVKALQDLLASKGYAVGAVDGVFSGGTRAAVLAAQADNGLPTTGEVDAATWAEFQDMPDKPISETRENATVKDLAAAGSETVKSGQSVSLLGKIGLALGLGGEAGHSTGALDHAQEALGQVQALRSLTESIGDIAGWATAHWWIFAAAGGFVAYRLGNRVIARRLLEHRNATNMNR
ncbi:peptidoglycan-binding protein [Bradyrhizobium japonicum]|uniref:peptidoglycan-binding protein n=1 Tax=Bradyrhizobium japonicum TaxID=375 RepID=UPI0004176CAB|nr:peptidoglycan-binding protein [Bradyrhizobium japonicum]